MILDNLSNEEFDVLMNKEINSYENGECISIDEFEKKIENEFILSRS